MRRSDGLQPHLIDVQFSQRMELTVRGDDFALCVLHKGAHTRACIHTPDCLLPTASYITYICSLKPRKTPLPRCTLNFCPNALYTFVLQEIAFFLDYRADESYTPSRLAVRAGCSHHDLRVCMRSVPCAITRT